MARLKFRSTRPPGGLKYLQPETRLLIDGDNYGELMKKVLAHRVYKGLPRATRAEVEVDVERQICARLSKNECVSEGPNDELRPVEETAVLTLSAVTRFTGAALRWLATGAELVPMDQLKKRQEICASCPLNQSLKACKCSIFYKTVDALVPVARRHPELRVCSACLCSTVAKTQMPLKMVLEADEGRKIQYPSLCWVSLERNNSEISDQKAS
jgi:hypothetical protein